MSIIHTIGCIRLRNAETGQISGTIDICRDDAGTIHFHVNRLGVTVTLRMLPEQARTIAELLTKAATQE